MRRVAWYVVRALLRASQLATSEVGQTTMALRATGRPESSAWPSVRSVQVRVMACGRGSAQPPRRSRLRPGCKAYVHYATGVRACMWADQHAGRGSSACAATWVAAVSRAE